MSSGALRSAARRALAGGHGAEPAGNGALALIDSGLAMVLCGGLLYANTTSLASSLTAPAATLRDVGVVLASVSVAARRFDPRWALTGAATGAALDGVLAGAPMVSVCIAFTAYAAAIAGEYALWWAPPAAASAVIAAAICVGQVHSWLAAAISSVAVVCVGWFAGQAARERRNRLHAAVEQRVERERQHAAELRQAAVDERLVIARELHDIVAHAMSVIAVRAGVARMVMDVDPVEVKETLSIIETTTRQALHEMRLLVAVLRQENPADAALAPAPGLADISALVEQVRLAGVELDVDIRGSTRPLPPGVDLSAYRIAQEALTNVVRHAGPTRATLRIEYRSEDVLIDVSDAGPAMPAAHPLPVEQRISAGHGLIGMSERVALFDGTLQTGRHGAGFQVNAVLRTDEPLS